MRNATPLKSPGMIDRRMNSYLQAGQAVAAKGVVPPLHSSTTAPGGGSIGRPIPRLEDERLLRGGSCYVSDLIATSNALRIGAALAPRSRPHSRHRRRQGARNAGR